MDRPCTGGPHHTSHLPPPIPHPYIDSTGPFTASVHPRQDTSPAPHSVCRSPAELIEGIPEVRGSSRKFAEVPKKFAEARGEVRGSLRACAPAPLADSPLQRISASQTRRPACTAALTSICSLCCASLFLLGLCISARDRPTPSGLASSRVRSHTLLLRAASVSMALSLLLRPFP